MRNFDDLTGQVFGIWKVIGFDHMEWYGADRRHGMSYYRCECQRCGCVKLVARSNLTKAPCQSHYGECLEIAP